MLFHGHIVYHIFLIFPHPPREKTWPHHCSYHISLIPPPPLQTGSRHPTCNFATIYTTSSCRKAVDTPPCSFMATLLTTYLSYIPPASSQTGCRHPTVQAMWIQASFIYLQNIRRSERQNASLQCLLRQRLGTDAIIGGGRGIQYTECYPKKCWIL